MGALTTINWAVTDVPFRKGQEAYIEFGKGCALLNSQGVTQQEIADRYEMSVSQIKQWCVVGADKRLRVSNTNFLPKSQYSLYLLTTLPDEDFEYVVEEFGEKARQVDINAVKAGFNTAKEHKEHIAFCRLWDEAHAYNDFLDRNKHKPEPEVAPEPAPKPALVTAANPAQLLTEEFIALLKTRNPIALKAIKAMFSTLYYPDTGKLVKDGERLASINNALDQLSKG
jgi:hypothetical protein